jgi:ATP-dependent helicase YprA (DUF1998 family)
MEDEWAEAEAAWEAECAKLDATALPPAGTTGGARSVSVSAAAAPAAAAAPVAAAAATTVPRRSKPLRQRVPSAGARKASSKLFAKPLAVLKWCFYELLLARQPAEIAERAGGVKVPVALAQIKPRADARLADQQLEVDGGVQLAHFARLCSLVPSLVKLRWTVNNSASGADVGSEVAQQAAAAAAVPPHGAVLDIVVTSGKTASARLKAVDRALAAIQKRAATKVKRAAKAGGGGLTIEDAVLAELPDPATLPAEPSEQSRPPRQESAASAAGAGDKDADELGSKRRLLSPEEVLKLPVRHPRGQDLIHFLQKQPWYTGQVVASVSRPARLAAYAELKGGAAALPSALYAALRSKGISRLYSHQAKAIDAALAGHHVVVSTATASGKSLAYVLPMIAEAVRAKQQDPPAGCAAFCLFPTKALAQDQLRSLKSLLGGAAAHDSSIADAVRPAAYDGDTPHAERSYLRKSCNVFLTNPDMLHASILPSHKQWSAVLSVLRFIVLDEMHVYKGVYGAHVAFILRRLLRLCALYGAPAPKFICCSATLPRPLAHFERLIPRPLSKGAVAVCEDGAPAAQHWLVLWQPPFQYGGNGNTDTAAVVATSPKRAIVTSVTSGPKPTKERQEPAESLTQMQKQALEEDSQQEQTQMDIEAPDPPARCSSLECGCGVNTALDGSTALGASAAGSLDFAALLAGRRGCLISKRTDSTGDADATPGETHTGPEASQSAEGTEVTLKGTVLTKPTPASPLKPTRSRRGHLSTAPSKRRRTSVGVDAAAAAAAAAAASEENRRCSPNIEVASVLAAILTTGCRALCFTKVRRMCEILCGYTTRILRDGDGSPTAVGGGGWSAVAAKVGTYRGGYTAEDRRSIEAQLLGRGGASSSSALQGVVCTNALELGVDIGELDAVVCLGYPGCSASLWQQVGRAGRKGEPALGVVVAYDSPVDAYFVRHPDRLLQQPVAEDEEADDADKDGVPERERLNPYLLQAHVICAAAELPLRLPLDPSRRVLNGHGYGTQPAARPTTSRIDPATVAPEAALDAALFGGFQTLRDVVTGGAGVSGGVGDMLSMAVEKGTDLFLPVAGSSAAAARAMSRTQKPAAGEGAGGSGTVGMVELWRANPALWVASSMQQQCRGPQPLVSIRAVGSTFSVQCTRTERELETVESSKAFFSLYEGSLYQHQQQLFKVVEVVPERRLAYACPVDPPRPTYITQPMHSLTLAVCKREQRRRFGRGVELLYGRLLVSVQVSAYVKCHRRTFEAFEKVPLHGLPPMEAVTSGMWLRLGDLPEELEEQRREAAGTAGAINFDFACGLHAANHALRVAANVLLDCDAADLCCEHESNELRILLYDGAAGGTGLSWEAYQRVTELVDTAVLLLTECECTNGCPACVLTCETGCYNDSVCKRSGLLLLAALQLRLVGGGSPSETLGTMPDEGQQQEQTQAQQTGNGQ